MAKGNCPICEKETSFINKSMFKIDGNNICSECANKLLQKDKTIKIKDYSLEQLKLMIGIDSDVDNNENWIKQYNNFYINEKEKLIRVNGNNYSFNEILDFDVISNENTINKADIGSVVARTMLFGSIIGGTTANRKNDEICTQLKIKITLNNLSYPIVYIDFLDNINSKKLLKSSKEYIAISEELEKCTSILQIIIKKN